MNHIAKIFMNGQSQAVRLPKQFRFESKVVYVRRNTKGEVILSEKPRTWTEFFNENSDVLGFETLMADREQDMPFERDLFLMEYLLDTNIVGYILKGVASNKLKNKLMMINPDDVFISQITHAEIIYGLQKGGNIIKHINRVNSFLETLSILDWDEQCAHAYGKVRNELRLQGVTVQSMDLMIGAHAIGHNMTLISNDHIFDHFKQFGLVLENWQTA